MNEARKVRPGRITDEQIGAYSLAHEQVCQAGKAGPGYVHAIRAGLAAAYVQRERERQAVTDDCHCRRDQREYCHSTECVGGADIRE